jgi:hypothetical protein
MVALTGDAVNEKRTVLSKQSRNGVAVYGMLCAEDLDYCVTLNCFSNTNDKCAVIDLFDPENFNYSPHMRWRYVSKKEAKLLLRKIEKGKITLACKDKNQTYEHLIRYIKYFLFLEEI